MIPSSDVSWNVQFFEVVAVHLKHTLLLANEQLSRVIVSLQVNVWKFPPVLTVSVDPATVSVIAPFTVMSAVYSNVNPFVAEALLIFNAPVSVATAVNPNVRPAAAPESCFIINDETDTVPLVD
jgi:hypothetical protein